MKWSEEKINSKKIPQIIPIPRPIQILKIGDKVDILECTRECGNYEDWSEQAKNMVGKKEFLIQKVDNNGHGIYYNIDGWTFPHHCVAPHIETEKESEKKTYTEEQIEEAFNIFDAMDGRIIGFDLKMFKKELDKLN